MKYIVNIVYRIKNDSKYYIQNTGIIAQATNYSYTAQIMGIKIQHINNKKRTYKIITNTRTHFDDNIIVNRNSHVIIFNINKHEKLSDKRMNN